MHILTIWTGSHWENRVHESGEVVSVHPTCHEAELIGRLLARREGMLHTIYLPADAPTAGGSPEEFHPDRR